MMKQMDVSIERIKRGPNFISTLN